MKQKRLTNYLKLGVLLFGIAIFLVNCQKDDDFKNHEANSNNGNIPFKVEKINLKGVKRNGHFENVKPKSKQEKNQNLKIYNSIYNFQIDTDYVTYIESGDGLYHSYTFPVIREVQTDSLENLLLSLQKDGSYAAFIVSYSTTAQEKQDIIDGKYVDINGKVTYTPMDDLILVTSILNDKGLNTNISSKEAACGWSIYTVCSGGNHANGMENGEHCPGWQMIIEYNPCESNGAGTGWSPPGGWGETSNPNTSWTSSDPPNSDGSYNGGSDNENTEVTSPTPPCQIHDDNCIDDYDPIHEDNCRELNKLINNPATTASQNNPNIIGDHKSTRIAILNCASQLGSNFEHGYGFYNKNNFPQYGPYAHNIPAAQDNHVHFPGNPTQYGTVHSHPNNGERIPMFSHDDMYSLLHIKNQYGIGNITPDFGNATFVCVLVVNQGDQTYTYAIKIEDATKLLNLDSYEPIEKGRKWREFSDLIRKKYTEDANGVNGSAAEYQKTFLKLVKDLDLGIALYKMKPNNLNDPTELETWEKLSLDNNGNLANPKPCN